MLELITPIILTFNEEPNISRSLAALEWAKEVLVVDSGSRDDTLEICRSFPNVRVVHNAFESFAQQSNFALQQDIKSPWVLSMDADYVVTPTLIEEIANLKENPKLAGYRIHFDYLIDGRALRGSLYPPRICLYRRDQAQYQQDGHAHKVSITGDIGHLQGRIQHDDRKPHSRWLHSQKTYASQESRKLKGSAWRELSWPDRIRKSGTAPLLILPYTLLAKGVCLDGAAGWKYARQRLIAETYLFKALFLSPEISDP